MPTIFNEEVEFEQDFEFSEFDKCDSMIDDLKEKELLEEDYIMQNPNFKSNQNLQVVSSR